MLQICRLLVDIELSLPHTSPAHKDIKATPLTFPCFHCLLHQMCLPKVVLVSQRRGGTADSTRGVDQEKLQVLFNLVVADLHLTLLEQRLPRLPGASQDEGVEMLECCARLGESLAHDGHAMTGYLGRMETARQTLRDVGASQMAGVAERYKLPDISALFRAEDAQLPVVALPSPPRRPSSGSGGTADAKIRSMKNLSGLPLISMEGRALTPQRLDDTVAWATDSRLATGHLQSQLVLREIEWLLFETAAQQKLGDAARTFGDTDASKLVKLVNTYRAALGTFLNSSSGRAQMRVELRSRETLVVWVAYVVSFAVARHRWLPSMVQFGVCLRPDDLKHLVLSDKLATDAALKVADFLRAYTRPQRAVFTLADRGSATFDLAANVARDSSHIRGIWGNEVAASRGRRDAHWVKVKALQETRAVIREDISMIKAELFTQEALVEKATQKRSDSQIKYEDRRKDDRWDDDIGLCRGRLFRGRYRFCWCQHCLDVTTAESECSATRARIEGLEKRLRDTERISPVLQPFPEAEAAALPVLFFLHMPQAFRSLAHLSFLAQQVLLPQQWDTSLTEAVKQPPCSTHWHAYCIKHRLSNYFTLATPTPMGQEGRVTLGYCGEVGEPETMVDKCGNPSDGVWHPDTLSPGRMLWQGGDLSADQRSFYFDPFSTRVCEEWVAREFTEQLPGSDRSLQWAMPQYGISKTSSERGNVAIATQSDAPTWLSKRQYLAFGRVRAYPLMQCRQLALALKDRILPLDRLAVRVLVAQALFQLGELSSSQPATLLWRHDQADTFSALFHELKVSLQVVTVSTLFTFFGKIFATVFNFE